MVIKGPTIIFYKTAEEHRDIQSIHEKEKFDVRNI